MDRHDPTEVGRPERAGPDERFEREAGRDDPYASEHSAPEPYVSESSAPDLYASELDVDTEEQVPGSPAPRVPWAALGLDATLVVIFAGLGRLSHAEGLSLTGLLGTAVPFLVGTLVGWAVLVWRRLARPASLAGGAIVWLSTVVIGMIVRVLAGGSTAFSFVLVSLVVTGLLLLGWRALGAYLVRRSAA